jgi:hypothetical protein
MNERTHRLAGNGVASSDPVAVDDLRALTSAFDETSLWAASFGALLLAKAPLREVEHAGLADTAALERLDAHEDDRGSFESVTRQVERHGFVIRSTDRDVLTLRYRDGSALLRHPLTVVGFLPA